MSLTTLTENRDAAFEMARLALTQPRFDAEPLERIKRQMLVGIRTRETNPGYIANLALDQALYPDHPYARAPRAGAWRRSTAPALHERRAAMFNARDDCRSPSSATSAQATPGALIDTIFGALPQGAHAAGAGGRDNCARRRR